MTGRGWGRGGGEGGGGGGGGGGEFSKPQKNRKQHEINYKYRLFEINLDRERSSFFPQSQASEIMQINGKKEERLEEERLERRVCRLPLTRSLDLL